MSAGGRGGAAVQAVTFDAGGTLFDMRASVGDIYAEFARRHGAELVPRSIDASFAAAFPTMPPLAFPDAAPEELEDLQRDWWKRLVRDAIPRAGGPADFDAYFMDVYEYFRTPDAWELYPETVPTLRALSAAGVRLGVISNFDSRLDDLVDGLGLRPWAEVVICSSRAGAVKPDRRIFERALECLSVAPERALHVGDSLRADVGGAIGAGMQAVLVRRPPRGAGVYAETREGEPAQKTAGATVVSSLAAVIDLV